MQDTLIVTKTGLTGTYSDLWEVGRQEGAAFFELCDTHSRDLNITFVHSVANIDGVFQTATRFFITEPDDDDEDYYEGDDYDEPTPSMPPAAAIEDHFPDIFQGAGIVMMLTQA
jgi:hypothetical protein